MGLHTRSVNPGATHMPFVGGASDDSDRRLDGVPVALVAGIVSALATFGFLVAMWDGPNHRSFGSPDEALTARAIEAVVEDGIPAYVSPFTDSEGVFRMRLWASVDGRVVPTHTPFLLYVYGLAASLGQAGRWLILLLPALGVGAFVAAGALLIPRFRWLAITLPGLAFPFTFRFTKPWENMAALSAFIAIGILFWVLWYKGRQRWALIAHLAVVLVAISIRPDQAHIIGGISFLATVPAARRHERSWLVGMYFLVAAIAVVVFLAENSAVTGDPLVPPAYLLEGTPGSEIAGKDLPPGLSHAVSLLFPKGLPNWEVISFQTTKYWWQLGPIRYVTIAAVATLLAFVVGNARRHAKPLAWVLLASFGLMAVYFLSRMNTTDWGADQAVPSLGHSLPRYSAFIYASAALLALVGVVKAMAYRRWVAVMGIAGLMVCSWLGVRYLADGEVRTSLSDATELVAAYEAYADRIDADAPDDALFYVRFADKFVWATRPTALLPTEPGSSREDIDYSSLVRSLEVSIASGFSPVLFELNDHDVESLSPLLKRIGFELKESAMGRTEYLDEVLIRWDAWIVERMVST